MNDAAQVPALQECVAEGSAEGVSRSEAIEGFNAGGGDEDAFFSGFGQGSLQSLLDDSDFNAAFKEGVCGAFGLVVSDGDRTFLKVADGDIDVGQDGVDFFARVLFTAPKTRAVVEVENGPLGGGEVGVVDLAAVEEGAGLKGGVVGAAHGFCA